MIELLLRALPWFLLVGAVGFFGKWRLAAALNVVAVLVTMFVMDEASRLLSNEDTDQNGFFMMGSAGLMMIATFVGVLATLIGAALGMTYRDRLTKDRAQETGESS